MSILAPYEAIPREGYYDLTATGAAKLILYLAYEPDQSDCSPEQQAKNLAAVGKSLDLAKSRGFTDGDRLTNLLARGPADNAALIVCLFARLFFYIPAEEFLRTAGFEPKHFCQGGLQ